MTGTLHLARHLALDSQKSLAAECLALGGAAAGFYTPVVRGMHPMSVKMLCLGRHWNAVTYRYEPIRTDVDGLEVPPLPAAFADVTRAIASAAGFTMNPDICIVNWYRDGSRMGLHQDKDESERSLAAGLPVVSVSLGDTARFLFGGTKRRDAVQTISLASGDAFVFGGPARLCYHGVSRILPGTAPDGTGPGRFNLTFRQW